MLLRKSLSLLLASLLFAPPVAFANPAGGNVQAGSATITGQGSAMVNVQQHSKNAVLSWEKFNIKPGETTNFHQPGRDSIAVNRIFDQNASQILGNLNANGNVYLINPNGILFGPGAQVNVGGLAAATSYRAGQKMIEGGFDPSATSAPNASIVNQGTIRARDGGFIYLVAPRVENGSNGVIVAPGGSVSIAAGNTVHLTDRADGNGVQIEYTAPGAAGDAPTELAGVLAGENFAKLRAGALRQAGVIEANALRERDGRIELYAATDLELTSGSRTAATGGSEGPANGGKIHAFAEHDAVVAAGSVVDVSGSSKGGRGGALEVSAKNRVELAGEFRADGHGGEAGGQIVVDPSVVDITGDQIVQGASNVKITADQTIRLENNASVNLTNANGTPTYALHSGGDVVFGAGSKITDGGTGDATNHWNVQIVAGATDLSLDGLGRGTKANVNAGGVYLGGATGSTTGSLNASNGDGEVSLTAGDITVRASGDVRIGNAGGLKNQRGKIDVEAGRDVRFSAGSKTTDGVIENGSGDIRVVAGNAVSLKGTGDGNAAIRTRGVAELPDPLDPSRIRWRNGGNILVQALLGDVDAGIGNRWVVPGPASQSNPNADPMPVARVGILGIGTEAGGDVTVIAGGDVRTDDPSKQRTGGSAALAMAGDATSADYTGSHIGLFGSEIEVKGSGSTRTIELLPDDTRESRLLVIAGGDISGDYMVRHGRGVFRAGYSLAPNVDPKSLDAVSAANLVVDPRAANAQIRRSVVANADPNRGWFGPLARPVTVDIIDGRPMVAGVGTSSPQILAPTVDALGANGIAIRAIETPSLVYSASRANSAETRRIARYSDFDSAVLEAETGDVVLVGNTPPLPAGNEPQGGSGGDLKGQLMRILPPNLTVRTHTWCPGCDRTRGLESRSGDFVMVNDFLLFPSAFAGLTLDVAGKVRTANLTAVGPTALTLDVKTTGASALQSFSLPSNTQLYDPITGLTFTLQNILGFDARIPAQSAVGEVLFRADRKSANQAIVIPEGTRIADIRGQVYSVQQNAGILAPPDRYSEGKVTFFAANTTHGAIDIPTGTQLTAPDGTIFRTVGVATLQPNQREITIDVLAAVLPGNSGRDTAAYKLRLEAPIAGIASATNRLSTSRPAQVLVAVKAESTGIIGNAGARNLIGLLDPIKGIEPIYNVQAIKGGVPDSPFGLKVGQDSTVVVSQRAGPVGRNAAGHRLYLVDPSLLPPGVSASEIELLVNAPGDDTTLRPAVLRSVAVERENGEIVSTRVDPLPTEVASSDNSQVWVRSSPGSSALLKQSDAGSGFDGRAIAPAYNSLQSYANYYANCKAGVSCEVDYAHVVDGIRRIDRNITLGTGPTHANDTTPAQLVALGGFERVRLELAEAARLYTESDVYDLSLRTQHSSASDVTSVLVPYGNASFGAGSRTLVDTDPATGARSFVTIPDQASTGIQIAGPGRGELLVGVVPFAMADTNGDGVVTFDEFNGPRAVFDGLDNEEIPARPDGYEDSVPQAERQKRPVLRDGLIYARNAPYLPTGRGGSLRLQNGAAQGDVLGLQTVGNIQGGALPTGGAALDVAAAGDIALGDRGFIGTLQGGLLRIFSVGGGLSAGTPPPKTTTKRGIVTTFTGPGFNERDASGAGGGNIRIDLHGNFDIGGLALAALSGSSIRVKSRAGSIIAGRGQKFSSAKIAYDNNIREVTVRYEGSGISAPGGRVSLDAFRNVEIGAGIFAGNRIDVRAGENVVGGTGALQSGGGISIDAGRSISGSIQAVGSVSITGGSVASGANVTSTGGVVAGAGGAVSNSSPGRTSAETSKAGDTTGDSGLVGGSGLGQGGGGSGAPTGRRSVRIDVSSRLCGTDECSS